MRQKYSSSCVWFSLTWIEFSFPIPNAFPKPLHRIGRNPIGFLWMKTNLLSTVFSTNQCTSDVSEYLDEKPGHLVNRVCVWRSSKAKRKEKRNDVAVNVKRSWRIGVVTGRGKPGFLMQCEVRHEPPCDQGSAWLQVAGMLLPLVEPAGVSTVQGVSEAGINAAAVHCTSSCVLCTPFLSRTRAARGTPATSAICRDTVATEARRYHRQAATL